MAGTQDDFVSRPRRRIGGEDASRVDQRGDPNRQHQTAIAHGLLPSLAGKWIPGIPVPALSLRPAFPINSRHSFLPSPYNLYLGPGKRYKPRQWNFNEFFDSRLPIWKIVAVAEDIPRLPPRTRAHDQSERTSRRRQSAWGLELICSSDWAC